MTNDTIGVQDAPSVSRRLYRLLTAFDVQRETLSLAEISRRSGLPKSTAHRLTNELVNLGLLERSDGELKLGLKLFELGQLVPSSRLLRDAARPVLEDLQRATGQTVHFAVRDIAEIIYLEILNPPRELPLPSRVGGRLPAYCSGVGKVLLANSPTSLIRTIVGAGLPRRTPYTICLPGQFMRELKKIRDEGVGYDCQEAQLGIACVASPVFGADGRIVAALSVTGRTGRMDFKKLTPGVRMAGMTLTRRLKRLDISTV